MNFLAHYVVGTMPDDPLYTLGCVLPDFVRNAKKGLRLKPKNGNNASSLDVGVAHHFRADKIFHNSGYFKRHSSELKMILANNGFQDRRYGFFTAHIAVELLLDRLLMKTDVLKLDRFYYNLANINENDLHKALQAYNIHGISPLLRFVERFTSSRYLYYYQSLNGLIFAINRIHERVGLEPFENQNVGFLVEMDATVAAAGLSIIGEINRQLLP